MFCTNCGKENPNNSKYCYECGAPLIYKHDKNKELIYEESIKAEQKNIIRTNHKVKILFLIEMILLICAIVCTILSVASSYRYLFTVIGLVLLVALVVVSTILKILKNKLK